MVQIRMYFFVKPSFVPFFQRNQRTWEDSTRILNLRNKNPNDTALHLRHLPLFTGFAIDRDQPEQQIIEYYPLLIRKDD